MNNKRPSIRPDDAVRQADQAFRTGDLANARKFCELALAGSPDHFYALSLMGILAAQTGNRADAEMFLGRAAAANPKNPLAHSNFGNALLESNKFEAALQSYDLATGLNPAYAEAHNNRGLALQKLKKTDEAIDSFKRAIKIRSDYAEAHNNLGNALHDINSFAEAVESYDQAINIQPHYADAYNNRGLTFHALCDFDKAIRSYQQAIAIEPGHAEAVNNLGNALMEIGEIENAIAHYRKAIQINGEYAEAHNNLGIALLKSKKPESALACFTRALAIQYDYAEAYSNRGDALKELKLLDEAINSYERAVELKPDFSLAHSNLLFCMNYLHSVPQKSILEESTRWNDIHASRPLLKSVRHLNSRQIDKRLRIGYVSPDFRNHPVAHFIMPCLSNHDRENFEIFCYYTHYPNDETTGQLSKLADHWRLAKGKTDIQLADQIRSDGIDILVDLAGHTAHNRLLTFAEKPAPIAITYLGYPNTTGLAAIDYRITDGYANPPGQEELYSEKLLRLPHSLWCYHPPERMPPVSPLPALTNNFLTFGSFNNFNKIDDKCIKLWATIMREIPDSRLVFVTIPAGISGSRLAEKFVASGVSGTRLSFHGNLPGAEFRQLLQKIDITLDPVTVNGATSTCESLWMGVPVISLVGMRFLERAGLSILNAAGMPEFAVNSAEECVAFIKRIANDLPGLSKLRCAMREKISRSPLMNEALFTRNLESLYRSIWTDWCNSPR